MGFFMMKKAGVKTKNNPEKAKVFRKIFSSVFAEQPDQTWMLTEEERPNIKHYLKISITNENLQKRLQALNPNQFTDPDGIHQKIFKETAPEISKPLQIISNESVKQGKLASAWKKVSIKAIYKIKPDEHCATNYRSMILAIMICNLMKMFIKDATVRVPHTKNILTNKQFGFMKGSLQS